MRKVIVGAFVSMDGVMQAPGGPEEDPSAKFELGGWVFPFWDDSGDAPAQALHGFCKTCYYADVCRGGCAWTAHVTLGRPGNNPFCYHRAATLRGQGIRERLVQVRRAPGIPYDFGRFELVSEPIPNPAEEV